MDPQQVDVYWTRSEAWSDEALARAWEIIDRDERERAGRFRFEHDRRTYVVAHAMVRRALSRHAPVDPGAWAFLRGQRGRPEIAGPAAHHALRFSLSHTAGLAACAVLVGSDVGIDVENVERDAPLGLLDSMFAPSERSSVRASVPGRGANGRFYVHWTLKEAYAKARGLGLHLPFEQIQFECVPDVPIRASFGSGCPDAPSRWRFESWLIGGRHRVALAVPSARVLRVQTTEVSALEEHPSERAGRGNLPDSGALAEARDAELTIEAR